MLKEKIVLVSVFVAIIFLSLFLIPKIAFSSTNLIRNGDFSVDPYGEPPDLATGGYLTWDEVAENLYLDESDYGGLATEDYIIPLVEVGKTYTISVDVDISSFGTATTHTATAYVCAGGISEPIELSEGSYTLSTQLVCDDPSGVGFDFEFDTDDVSMTLDNFSVYEASAVGTIEEALTSGIVTSVGSVTGVITGNLSKIFVIVAGLIGISIAGGLLLTILGDRNAFSGFGKH